MNEQEDKIWRDKIEDKLNSLLKAQAVQLTMMIQILGGVTTLQDNPDVFNKDNIKRIEEMTRLCGLA